MFPVKILAENWKEPLDVTLPIRFGEIEVPFPRHIHQFNPSTSDRPFPQFSRLPVELRLQVLRCCDKPTLFRLMHTSREMRLYSEKLFFSDPDTWYRVDGDWILKIGDTDDNWNGKNTHWNDTTFLSRVERIQIDFKWRPAWACHAPIEKAMILKSQKMGYHFWLTVRRLFPRVKSVILADHICHRGTPLPMIEYTNAVQLSPPNIEVFLSATEKFRTSNGIVGRRLWRQVDGKGALKAATADWEECADYLRPRVVPPNTPRRNGPLGEYYQAHGLFREWVMQRRSVRMHKLAAMEKYHLQASLGPSGSATPRKGDRSVPLFKPFGCLAPDFDTRFERPGEYTAHAMVSDHDAHHDIPEPFKDIFAANDERLRQMRQTQVNKWHAVRQWWGVDGSERQETAKRQCLHQMRNDPLWADHKPENGHQLWCNMEYFVTYPEWYDYQ